MKRMVNGQEIELTPDEESAVLEERAAVAANPPVPQVVSRFQALAALSNAGLLSSAQAAVDQEGGLAKLAWDNALEFRRTSPTLLTLASALNLSDGDLDNLFRAAAQIEA